MSTFTLSIDLGNAAMQTGEEIADALVTAAEDIRRYDATTGDTGRIRDENGNTVGRWEVTE